MQGFVLFLLIVCGLICVIKSDYNVNSLHDFHDVHGPEVSIEHEMTHSSFWFKEGQQTVHDKIKSTLIKNRAKNVIFFIGDGMSLSTITAARILKGQLAGKLGERSKLAFERFPTVGLSKTYCADKQVPDSACTATAYLGGIKGNLKTIGVNANVSLNDCDKARDPTNQVESILSWAQRMNKATGIVTTAAITDASPAAAYSHVANRDFESDAKVKELGADPSKCIDIAQQLISNEIGQKLNVVLGGGTKRFLPKNETDFYGNPGERLDGRNLIKEWENSKKGVVHTVYNKQQLMDANLNNVDHLLGLFAPENMPFITDADSNKEPSLERMTGSAIKMLHDNENGFVLFVEAAHIDKAHHANMAHKALMETIELSKAVQKAIDMSSPEETLIVVTSDHSSTLTISGYPDIGKNILGLSSNVSDEDQLPYTTLNYANGPSYFKHFNWTGERLDLTNVNVSHKDFMFASTFPTKSATHGGDDVPIYASGPWAHLFSGVIEQSDIPHLMGYAACLGHGIQNSFCLTETEGEETSTTTSGAEVIQTSVIFVLMISLLAFFFKNH